jgi:hypothetical protein
MLIHISLFGQEIDVQKIENDPKLTSIESEWLNKNVKIDNFNFDNKQIGFVEMVSGGFYGVGKHIWTITKKNFFRSGSVGNIYKLYVLSEEEKKQKNGLDAVLVVASKKVKGKMRRMKRAAAIAYSHNAYPQIPADAGVDNNPLLSKSNAVFFNEIYKYDNYFTASFDFTGKKLAIFDSQCTPNTIKRRSIAEYVDRIKKQLDEYGFCRTEFTYTLTEQQKKESGGYDVIIQYRCKPDLPLDLFIKELAKAQ